MEFLEPISQSEHPTDQFVRVYHLLSQSKPKHLLHTEIVGNDKVSGDTHIHLLIIVIVSCWCSTVLSSALQEL